MYYKTGTEISRNAPLRRVLFAAFCRFLTLRELRSLIERPIFCFRAFSEVSLCMIENPVFSNATEGISTKFAIAVCFFAIAVSVVF